MANPVAEVAGIRRESARARDDRSLVATVVQQLDWLLLGGIVALVGFGLWALAGITNGDDATNHQYYVVHQGVFVGMGAVGFLTAVALGPGFFRRWWRAIYVGTLFLLLVVLADASVRHTHRWISIGSFQFQPSEFGKPLLVLALGGFLAERGRRVREPQTALVAVALAIPAIVLVFAQPDLGTALVYAAALAAVLVFGGTPWLQLAFGGAVAVAGAVLVLWGLPGLGVNVLKPYQKARLVSFMNTDRDPAGPNYNVTQSKTAVASGGVHGRGISNATQTKYNFLPAHRTDFAFAAFAEQHGFVGATALLLLYLLVLWRSLRVVALATDQFSATIVGSIVVMILFQIAINVGMTMQIAPVTGIPLPFVSYGGSAVIATLFALGLIVGVQVRAGRRRTV